MPRLGEVEFYAVEGSVSGHGEVVPETVAAEPEELEELVALGASDVGGDVPLAGLQGVDAFEVLSPGVAVQGVVGLPLLSVLIGISIAAAVDTVEVLVAVGSLDEVAVAVGSGGESLSCLTHIHIVGGCGLLPGGDEPLVVDGSYLVDATVGPIGLHTAGIVVRVENPLEVSAYAVGRCGVEESLVGQSCLGLKQGGETLLRVFGTAMQVDGAPGTVFAVEQLLGLQQFFVVVVGRASIGAAPVLDDIPVGALAAIAGGDGALVAAGGVERADDGRALLGESLGQHTLVLQSPQDDRRTVAPLLDPAHQQSLEVVAELVGVVPDVGGELAPEEDALFVAQLLIEQMMGLVSLAQGVESGIGDLLHARANLLGCEGVAGTQQVLILAGAVDEYGAAVEVEAVVGGCRCCLAGDVARAEDGPRDAADAEWRAHLVGGGLSALGS